MIAVLAEHVDSAAQVCSVGLVEDAAAELVWIAALAERVDPAAQACSVELAVDAVAELAALAERVVPAARACSVAFAGYAAVVLDWTAGPVECVVLAVQAWIPFRVAPAGRRPY